jgi:hypothetical protein
MEETPRLSAALRRLYSRPSPLLRGSRTDCVAAGFFCGRIFNLRGIMGRRRPTWKQPANPGLAPVTGWLPQTVPAGDSFAPRSRWAWVAVRISVHTPDGCRFLPRRPRAAAAAMRFRGNLTSHATTSNLKQCRQLPEVFDRNLLVGKEMSFGSGGS